MNKKAIQIICIWIIAAVILVFAVMFGVKLSKNALVQSGYGDAPNSANQYAKDVTMIQLIATPEKYDGEFVRVIGVGNLEFEGNYIALSKEDIEYHVGNQIWIELGDKAIPYEEAAQYNGEYVLVEGIFDKNDTGHGGMFHGTITDISRYELWDPITDPDSTIPDNTVQNDTVRDLPAAYGQILENIVAAHPWNDDDLELVPENPELSYMYRRHTELSEVGFALMDLDSNGQEELLISGIDSPFVYDLYTIVDGEAVQVFSSGDRYAHFVYADGKIEKVWSGSAACSGHDYYTFQDGQLVFNERVTHDAFHAEDVGLITTLTDETAGNCYFKSPSEDFADYIHISFDEYLKIMDTYKDSFVALEINLIPLSEY
ncbi:MAG: hypothetical protein IJZ56_00995 [Oscillospiraceae bacterium]|nr:hypothetical protein [Oscillospiraceae bacterium]